MSIRNIQLHNNLQNTADFHQRLSLSKYMEILDRQSKSEGMEARFPLFMLDTMQGWLSGLSEEDVSPDANIWNLIWGVHSIGADPVKNPVAFGYPIPDKLFCGTAEFEKFFKNDIKLISNDLFTPFTPIVNFPNKILYGLIMERFYHIPVFHFEDVYEYKENNVNRYFGVKTDFTYVDIKSTATLPKIDIDKIKDKEINSIEDLLPAIQSIDLKDFEFSGFTIMQIFDRTNEYVNNQLQTIIGNLSAYNLRSLIHKLKKLLYTLLGSKEIELAFLPLFELNDVPIMDQDYSRKSIIFNLIADRQHDTTCKNIVNEYFRSPYVISYGVAEDFSNIDQEMLEIIEEKKIKSYACVPFRHQNQLVGFLELYAHQEDVLNRERMIAVRPFFSILTQLAFDMSLEFKNRLNSIVSDHFTAIQPSVQWRFNQVAAHYLNQLDEGVSHPKMEKVIFEDVHPFYGAIDVKNSTIHRNDAYQADGLLFIQFIQPIIHYFENCQRAREQQKFLDNYKNISQWLDHDNVNAHANDIYSFFTEDIPHFLENIPKELIVANGWEHLLNPAVLTDFQINSNEHKFEESLQMVNAVVGKSLERFHTKILQIVPAYFEKFRTDGMEYDLYVGPSIKRDYVYDAQLNTEILRAQLLQMIEVGKLTYFMQLDMPVLLETTQLIFCYSNNIDISFRLDEKHFDVEGGYNIRYQMLKKRIDKVLIRDTQERLVQPGKIAVVYSDLRSENMLKEIVFELVKKGLIEQKLDFLDLEEMQGVYDLKALRVSINYYSEDAE